MRIPKSLEPYIRALGAEAASRGLGLAAVGGCVRDWLLGRPTKDLDLVVEGDAEALLRLCRERWGGTSEAFGAFGTHRVFLRDGFRIDFARARRETYASPAALPDVRPAGLAEDLWRRDFSVNAMALSLPGRELLDPTGGRADLRKGRLRVLHRESFRDDPTRVFRAARFAARFGFRLEAGTARSLRACVADGLPSRLSRERLRQELWRLLEERDPAPALSLLRRWRALGAVQPGLRWSEAAFKDPDPSVRLGVLAALQGGRAEAFIAGLKLDRALAQSIGRALQTLRERRSPRAALGMTELGILRALKPGLPRAAVLPVLATGDDLKRLGAAPGPGFSRLLAGLARAQWEGRVKTRSEALERLKQSLPAD